MIGTTIGKYRFVGQLGRGATGIVYEAIDETLDRPVAVKILNPALAEPDLVKRFRAEATILARLNHPEIAIIYELVQRDADFLMVMELVPGETLERLCERAGPLPPERAASLTAKILSALGHAHRAGVVHRDVKPANVMVTDRDGVKMMDFGIARIRGAEHMTIDGCTIGTPAYMSPEQVLGEEVDGRADLYSVGVILYRLLAGTLPFDADTPFGMLQKQMGETAPPLQVHRPDLPAWCDAIVQRALAKLPGDRYQSAEEFRDALAGASGIRQPDSAFAAPAAEGSARAGAVQTVEIPVPAEISQTRGAQPAVPGSGAASFAGWREAWLRNLKTFARAREGTVLAVLIVVAVAAYIALDGSPPVPAPSIRASALPTLVFETKALVGSGTRQRERDVQLVLDQARLTVTSSADPEKPLYSVPYRDVISISYSRGRDPLWTSPKGPAPVVRVTGGTLGKLGIFVDRPWIAVQTGTDAGFIVLRVEDPVAKKMLASLEERTGRAPDVVRRR